MAFSTFERILSDYSSKISVELEKVFKSFITESGEYHPFIKRVYEVISEFSLRKGKRLAASATLMAYKGYANKINQDILNICCGIELYRGAILIHDDIADLEFTRRGGKTVHEILKEGYDERLGWASAIFSGNMISALAVLPILRSKFDYKKIIKAADIIVESYKDVNESQILDLLFEYTEPNVREWEKMAAKRAVTLFKASILTGAILAGAPDEDIRLLEEAAVNIGYAFDIQDDIIDTFSPEESYGRPSCGDISKSKKPLHIILAMEKDRAAAKFFYSLKNKDLTTSDVEKIRSIIRDSGALSEAKSVSRAHAEKAKKLVNKTSMSEESKVFFSQLADYIKESLNWYS